MPKNVAVAPEEEVEVDDLEAIPEIGPSGLEPPKRKRGRPPGSKNKNSASAPGAPPKAPKQKLEIPPHVVGIVAQMPLQLAGSIAARRGVVLHFDPAALQNVNEAFSVWLASMDMELTPGWALLAAYSMALGSGAMNAQRIETQDNGQPPGDAPNPAS